MKDYQQRAFNNVNEILKNHKFAQVILPTGAGKSFVALAQMQQDEILNQIKNYIVRHIHGKKETVGKTVDEIIAEVFPNIVFESYSGLLAKRGQDIIKEQYGMIILDENSKILYLQQLGRAIYALDEENPLPDDKRPTIIDIVNI